MFNNLKQMKQLAGMLGNAGELKAKFEEIQAELAQTTVEGEAGGGAVRVSVTGHLVVTAVKVDPNVGAGMVAGGDYVTQIERLVLEATNDALAKARQLIKERMGEATGGLNLPGLEGLTGG
ncbi:MAG: YbaB/EbfC family nucleoid-associated protein [Algisphaera sp.]